MKQASEHAIETNMLPDQSENVANTRETQKKNIDREIHPVICGGLRGCNITDYIRFQYNFSFVCRLFSFD